MEYPCRWLAHTHFICQFVGRDTFIFTITDNGLKSLLQNEFQVVKDGMGRTKFIETTQGKAPCKWPITFCKGFTPSLFADISIFPF
jgi:hypothetical protein